MNKKKWSVLLVIFFLVQYSAPTQIFPAENVLSPQIRINSNSPDFCFKKRFDLINAGALIYKLDVIEEKTKQMVIKGFGEVSLGSDIKFDLKNIHMGGERWVRYYPFSIGGENFIMRIFLTELPHSQVEAKKILYEGKLKKPAVTFQVLPFSFLNDILPECKLIKTYSSAEVDESS